MLPDLCKAAGINEAVVALRESTMMYPTIEVFVETEVKGSPLETLLDAKSYQGFMREARKKLQRFRTEGGPVIMPMERLRTFILASAERADDEAALAKNFDNGTTNRPDAARRTGNKIGQ